MTKKILVIFFLVGAFMTLLTMFIIMGLNFGYGHVRINSLILATVISSLFVLMLALFLAGTPQIKKQNKRLILVSAILYATSCFGAIAIIILITNFVTDGIVVAIVMHSVLFFFLLRKRLRLRKKRFFLNLVECYVVNLLFVLGLAFL